MQKIKFKDYPLLHKMMLSACYGFIAFSAVLTAHAIKNNKDIKNPVCLLGTTLLVTPLYHKAVCNEIRQMKQKQRD